MKMHTGNATVVETKKKTTVEKFDVADVQMFIKMYRDTIYKNKIRVIPQEYMCNARDAHREIGKADVPIEVTLPTMLDPILRIRDFGPGIDDDRMTTFSSYGASTKRDSNNQTGGFGIGCKCAWSYTSAFTLETVYEEDGKRIRKIYSIYVNGDSDPGSVRTIKEKEIEESEYDKYPMGTTVGIPIKDNDIDNFVESIRAVGTYWDVKPIITNDEDFEFHNTETEIFGDNWKLCGSNNLYAIRSNSYAVIDGIAYTIDFDLLEQGDTEYEESEDNVIEVKRKLDENVSKFYQRSGVVFFYNTGDLRISPNREDLEYTVENIKILSKTMTDIRDDVVELFKKKVISNPDASLLEIVKQAVDVDLYNIELLWTDKNGDEIDITAFAGDAKYKWCYLYKDGDSSHEHGIPFNEIDDDTAIYHYGSEASATRASERLEAHPEILENINATKVLIIHSAPNNWHNSNSFRKYYDSFTNRKMGTIKIPRVSTAKSKIPGGKTTGIFKVASSSYLSASHQINSDDAGKIDFKKSLFISRRGYEETIFRGTDKERSFPKGLIDIHKGTDIYILNGKGEKSLNKNKIKINWIENRSVAKKIRRFFNTKAVRSREFSSNYQLNRLIPVKRHIYWYLGTNGINDPELLNLWDTYVKLVSVEDRSNWRKVQSYKNIASILGIKVDDSFDNVKIDTAKLEKNIPFLDLNLDSIGYSHKNKQKQFIISIIRSYKEYDDGK